MVPEGSNGGEAARAWADALAAWAIPDDIVRAAPESPWIHPPEMFVAPEEIADSPSHERARDVVAPGGSVLDVGCGGGVAAFAICPPATDVVGVDQQPEMLSLFAATAERRGVKATTVLGQWPDVASRVPPADVVTAHHVVYNVSDLEPFLRALDEHALARVVLELPDAHPLSAMNDAWRHFWGLERPSKPTVDDLMNVIADCGFAAQRRSWTSAPRGTVELERMVRFTRIRLCLPESRDDDVRDYLGAHPVSRSRDLSTIWWDHAPSG